VLVYAEPPPALVSAREPPYFKYGDTLKLQGNLQRPEPIEDFDYPSYLASQSISAVLWSREVEWVQGLPPASWRTRVFDLRRELSQSLELALPPDQSAVAQALLLGLRGQLPSDVVEDFRNTGTSHLLAISGLHVGVLLVMALGAATWLMGKQHLAYLLLPLAAIWLYALTSGMPVSVVRAAIMGSLYLLALAVGRPQSALPPLALSALLITALEPRALTQISFQLSFAAMAGIILALPYQARVSAGIRGSLTPDSPGWEILYRSLLAWTAAAIIVSLAATAATLPLVAFNFHRIPLLGIPATILALPAMPFILASSLSVAIAGLVHPLLGQVLGWIAWAPLSYLLTLASATPGITLSGAWVGTPLVWAWYSLLGLSLVIPSISSGCRTLLHHFASSFGDPPAGHTAPLPGGFMLGMSGIVLILGVSGMFLWAQVFRGPDGNLHVYFLDVGQGDSILLVTPHGRQVLVDGGPDANSAITALAGPLSPWDRSLDLVALTHLDADHSRGLLEVLDRYQVEAVLVGEQDTTADLYPEWQAKVNGRHIRPARVFAGEQIVLDEEVILEVLHPPSLPLRGTPSDRNNNGLVFRLVYGKVSFLLTADIEAEAENYLVRSHQNLNSSVMKVAHHGSQTSTTPTFLESVSPVAVVISAGENNRFGHPHPEVVQRLEQYLGSQRIYQTAEHGNIEFISDGTNLWVNTQR
jgi:competence protein ComEC